MKALTRSRAIAAALFTFGIFGAATAAHARTDVVLSVGLPIATYAEPAPVYVQPQPVYVQPRPVYVAPEPVYVRPSGYWEERRWREAEWRRAHWIREHERREAWRHGYGY